MYWVFKTSMGDDGVALSVVPEDGPESFLYKKGMPLAQDFPSLDDAIVCFDSNYPERIKLYDVLNSVDDVIVASKKVKILLDNLGVVNFEFLPITLRDHHGRPLEAEYGIINVLDSVDAVDMDSSEYKMNVLKKGQIKRFDKLSLKPDQISEDSHIFRLQQKMDEILISDTLKKQLEQENILGWKAYLAEGWDGLAL